MKTIVNSDYYEEPIMIDHNDAGIMLDIYLNIANDKKFEPEVTEISQMLDDVSSFDHVLYHVEQFGEKYPSYEYVKQYFEK